jgi:tRNA-binding protein
MTISWNDFEKIEIRAGTVLQADNFEKAHKPALILTIDFGEYGIKKSSAQITALYNKEGLVGQQVVAVLNVTPKQIGHFFSECLVLGIYHTNNEVVLLQPQQPVGNGSLIG